MRTLVRNHDLKRLFAGAAAAVVAGLTIGAAFQPTLDEEGVYGPQQKMAGGGLRNYAASHEPSVAAYQGQVPDYVVGTDWLRAAAPEQQVLAYDDRAETPADDATAYGEPAEAAAPARWQDEPRWQDEARWEDEPREAPLYPSEQGNTYSGADVPQPPEPPSDERFEPAAA